jgi:hypothetical protein
VSDPRRQNTVLVVVVLVTVALTIAAVVYAVYRFANSGVWS